MAISIWNILYIKYIDKEDIREMKIEVIRKYHYALIRLAKN